MAMNKKIKRICNVNVVDPAAGKVLAGRDIVIDNGRVTDVVEAAGLSGPEMLEGAGMHAIPGLIDAHVHATGIYMQTAPGLMDAMWLGRQQRKNLAAFLRAGVTTVRDLGSPMNMIKDYSRKAEKFEIESPRILYAGALICAPGGYPDFVKKSPYAIELLIGKIRIDVENAAQARRAVDRLADEGVHCIKVGWQSMKFDDARTAIPRLSVSVMNAICERAHGHGLPVAVHQAYHRDLPDLLETSFDSIEHPTMDEEITREEALLIHDKGLSVTTTLTTGGILGHADEVEALLGEADSRFEDKPRALVREACKRMRGGGEVSEAFGRKVVDTGAKYMKRNLAILAEVGVPVCFGTDAGGAVTPCGVPLWEFNDMKSAGFSNLEMLRSATTVAAKAVGRPELGRIASGAAADVVLLRSNPLKDIKAVGEVEAVVRDGRLCAVNKRIDA